MKMIKLISLLRGSKNFHLDTLVVMFVKLFGNQIIDDNIDVLNDAYFNNVKTIKFK